MFEESDLLPISALQHLLFCRRQCALIHVERLWDENQWTVEGHILHERAHMPGAERKGTVRVEFALPVRSLRLGLAGMADVVEFRPPAHGAAVGGEVPYPVEYKRGRPKADRSDSVQLCAQALCLEEMVGVAVPEGALFYGRERRRTRVLFADELRLETEKAARLLHELAAAGRTPPPEYGKKCRSCSLLDTCRPKPCGRKGAVDRYLKSMLEEP